MIASLVGSNSFALKQRQDELINGFVSKYGDLGLERIDATEAEAPAILEAVQSLPFLATRKMVVLRDLGANSAAAENVEQIIAAAGDQVDLVVVESAPDKRTSYYKTLAKKTNLESFEGLDAYSLSKWLVDESTRLGGQISSTDATYLVERLGPNQQMLANEVAKLITYNPQVSRETIDLLTEPTPQTKVFDLLDAAFAGNAARALSLYDEQRAQKVEPQMILAMIAWQLRILTALKLGSGKSSGQVAKDFGINPYVLSKSSRLANELTAQKLKDLVNQALDIDYKSKSTSLNLDEALKNYIVTL